MKKRLIVLICFLINGLCLAQPGGGGDPGGGEPVPLPALGILLAAGSILGVRAMLKKRDNQ